MSKALCIKKQDFFKAIQQLGNTALFTRSTSLEDRDICETDTTSIQIIPYITLIQKGTNLIFSYKRGTKGEEERLHSHVSIGLGGHVEVSPTEDKSLIKVLAEESARELTEEVGLTSEYSKQFELDILTKLQEGRFTILYDNSTVVGRVHVGVGVTIWVDQDLDLLELEEGIVTDTRWTTAEELYVEHLAEDIKLENWSLDQLMYIKTVV